MALLGGGGILSLGGGNCPPRYIVKKGTVPFLISAAKNVICSSNSNSHHFPNAVHLVDFFSRPILSNMSKNVEHPSAKIPKELMERFINLTWLKFLPSCLNNSLYLSFFRFTLFLRFVS